MNQYNVYVVASIFTEEAGFAKLPHRSAVIDETVSVTAENVNAALSYVDIPFGKSAIVFTSTAFPPSEQYILEEIHCVDLD